jgi:hypothetical protein
MNEGDRRAIQDAPMERLDAAFRRMIEPTVSDSRFKVKINDPRKNGYPFSLQRLMP